MSLTSSSRPDNLKQRSKSNMASATGIPADNPAVGGQDEDEPLLGGPGDASQKEGRPIMYNLFIGTGVIAQAGIWILAGIVWGTVFSKDLIFFSAHPLLNSAGILLSIQATLVLQPTHTQAQKINGSYVHSFLNNTGVLCLIAGLVIIEYNKISHGGTHFESPHAILGLITYILILIQSLVGFTAFFVPNLYGSVGRAKSLYKYHRMSGYAVLLLMFATVCASTQTEYNVTILHIKLWSIIVASLITLVGVVPRVRKSKLGL